MCDSDLQINENFVETKTRIVKIEPQALEDDDEDTENNTELFENDLLVKAEKIKFDENETTNYYWSSDDSSVSDPTYQPNYFDEEIINDKNIASTSNAGFLHESSLPKKSPNEDVVQTESTQSPDVSSFNQLESKKRKCRTRQQRGTSKRLRNSGQSYITELGKCVPERTMKKLNPCRLKCSERFKDEDRLKCFNEYWKLGNRDRRARYISSLMSILPKKTQKTDSLLTNRVSYCKYKLIINTKDNPICKECLCKTLGETKAFINVIMKTKKLSSGGIIPTDGRGLQPPRNKRTADEVLTAKNHILSFPSYESHYCRKSTNKKFLSSELSIAMMYRLYKEICPKPLSIKLYAKCFHDMKLAFKPPAKDTCHKCDLLNTKLKLPDSEENLKLFRSELDEHQILAEKAYEAKRKDKDIAIANSCFRTYAFDIQQCLPTPYLKTSVSFYKRQLWSFNLTIHNLANNDVTCYMWDETIGGRGANNIASCLYNLLKNLPPEVKEITFYSDTCGGQNKNNIVTIVVAIAI